MPRQPRLDAPGTLHHVMGRGIERLKIFQDDTDRDDFVSRLAALCRDGQWSVYAWALMPNHFHLLVRTGPVPLFRSMQKLLTGYVQGDVGSKVHWGTSYGLIVNGLGTLPSMSSC